MISEEDIKKLGIQIGEVGGSFMTVNITYEGQVIKTVEV